MYSLFEPKPFDLSSVGFRRKRTLAIPLAVAALLMVPIQNGFSQDARKPNVLWSDEFNGTEIDRSVWTHDIGGHGWGNGQLEYNSDRPENSYVKDGNLVIEARRESYKGNAFTSARMLTQGRFAFQYGDLEARIKVPDTADGIWPAFWMLGNNFSAVQWPKCGEADILEIGGKDGTAEGLQHRKINSALHFSDENEEKLSLVEWHDAQTDLHLDYHLYRISWTPKYMKFFLDGKEFASWDISAPRFREYHQPYFPILNVAVGSWATSYTSTDTPDKVTATLPSRLYVDWIRLYGNADTKIVTADQNQESGKFGVYTESDSMKTMLPYASHSDPEFAYGHAADLLIWNNMERSTESANPSEGNQCWSFDVAPGNWFGMGVFVSNHRNMTKYATGKLHFDIRTNSPVQLSVGIKSSRGGEAWVSLGDEKSEIGFVRDGKWHTVSMALDQFGELDFHTIHQLFMLKGESPQTTAELAIDNVWWEPGE